MLWLGTCPNPPPHKFSHKLKEKSNLINMLTSLLVTTACFAACDNCLKTLWEIIQSVSQRIQYSLKVSQDTFEWFIHPSRTIPIPLFQSLTPTPHWSQTIPAYTKPSQNIPNYPEPFPPILNHPYLSWSISPSPRPIPKIQISSFSLYLLWSVSSVWPGHPVRAGFSTSASHISARKQAISNLFSE